MGTHLYERLVAERFRRVWAVAELIAFEPGVTRQQMAKRFFVSERQIQADLYIVGNEMGLSLGRQSGYRFLDARGQPANGGLAFKDAVLLLESMRRTLRLPDVPHDAIRDLLGRVPETFAPHLRPFGRHAAARIKAGGIAGPWECVVKAICNGHAVKFRRLRDVDSGSPLSQITPEMLIPWRSGWYVIGEGNLNHDKRRLMVAVDEMVDALIVEKRAA